MNARLSMFVGLLSVVCCAGQSLHAADAEALMQQSPLSRGFVCLIDPQDPQLPLELARRKGWIVFSLVPDPAAQDKLIQPAMDAGLYGRRLYVETGSADALPFADHTVDLLIADQAGPDTRKEIMRVLTPIHGRAIVGNETIAKPELPGSDWWTHKRHLPDNNPASTDTVFRFPPLTQWRGMPMSDSGHGAALTANGIKLEMYDWATAKNGQSGVAGRMLARNVYNGAILWDRFAPTNILPSAPIMVAARDSFYIASGARAEVLRFDALTGKPLPGIVLDDEDRRVKWLAITGDRLYALIGGLANLKLPFSFFVPPPKGQWENHELFGDTLVCLDLNSNTRRWEHSEGNLIDDTNIAIDDGKLFFYSEKKRLVCFDAATGKELWSNSDPAWIGKLKRPPKKPHNVYVANTPNMIATDGFVTFCVAEGKLTHVFSAADGQLLSSMKGELVKAFMLDGTLYRGTVPVDPVTGEKMEADPLFSPAGLAWCGLATYAPGTGPLGHSTLGFKSACAQGAWVAGGILQYSPTLCNCGSIPGAAGFASGEVLLERAETSSEFPLEQGPSYAPIQNPESDIRKVVDWPQYRRDIHRSASSPASVGASARQLWTAAMTQPFAYNTNYNQYTLHFDDRPAPPVIADGKVFSAASDGMVRCHALADGKLLWTSAVGGAVMTSPAWHAGRLFVPAGDGWLYALEASDGSPAWRRRIAPLERRILVFGKLVSNWPVSAVLADEGVVYAYAGLLHHDGIEAMALDTDTGDIRWRRFTPPAKESLLGSHQNPDRPVFGAGGNIAKVGQRVWFNGHQTGPLVLDTADGTDHRYERLMQYAGRMSSYDGLKAFMSQGKEIMVMPQGAVLIGGAPLWMEQQMREGKWTRTNMKVYETDDAGDWIVDKFPVAAVRIARIAPAVDADLLAISGPLPSEKKGGRQATMSLHAWKPSAFLQDAMSLITESPYDEKKMKKRPGEIFIKRSATRPSRPLDYGKAVWSNLTLDLNAIAICRNAVLVAQAKSHRQLSSRDRKANPRGAHVVYDGWQIGAYDRTTGAALWTCDLPGEPQPNGLAVADDGTIVVTLRDGTLVAVK